MKNSSLLNKSILAVIAIAILLNFYFKDVFSDFFKGPQDKAVLIIFVSILVFNEAENSRKEDELARALAENARKDAENALKEDELARALAENALKDAENALKEDEIARVIAESARKEAESARKEAESARVIAESARKEAESAREIAKKNLHILATSVLKEIPIEKLAVPKINNSIKAKCQEEVAEIVVNFNDNFKNAIEKSGSFDDPNSVHHLWCLIIKCIQNHHGTMRRRVAYEWYIRNVCTDKDNSIDFTFIPSTDKFLNWNNYSGGLELKKNPPPSSLSGEISSANGPMATSGFQQATNRAAMCVLSRLSSESTKQLKSYCCYADSRRFGLVRVSVKSEYPYCEVRDTGTMSLPGFSQTSADTNSSSSSRSTPNPALNLLYHLLYASDEDLEYFMTPPISGHPEEFRDGENVLTLGAPLGSGGFAAVYHDLSAAGQYVIKCARDSRHLCKLNNEYTILSERLVRVQNIPKAYGFVRDGENIVALKLSPLSISLKIAMSIIAKKDKAIFLRNMGIQVLDILREAHHLQVSHNDVRCPNILITPSLEVREKIAESPYNIYDNISRRTFDTCTFLLNDWGEATYHPIKDSQKFKDAVVNDLRGVVTAICKSDYIVSSISPKNNNCEYIKPQTPIISDKVFEVLYSVASTNGIETLQKELMKHVK